MADASSFHSLTPSGTSFISDGDNTLRTNFGVLDRALVEEHYFSASASSNSAGIHVPGSARAYFGTFSQLSTPAANAAGRLMLTTDRGTLHYFHASSHSTIYSAGFPVGVYVRDANDITTSETPVLFVANNADNYAVGITRSGTSLFVVPSALSGLYHIQASIDWASIATASATWIGLALRRGTGSGTTVTKSIVSIAGFGAGLNLGGSVRLACTVPVGSTETFHITAFAQGSLTSVSLATGGQATGGPISFSMFRVGG